MVRKLSFNYPTPKVSAAYFALIIIIVVHIAISITCINKYMQKAGVPENDAGFPSI